MSAIDNLKQEIEDLENQRDVLYTQFQQIDNDLKRKKLLLSAFNVVSSDTELYNKWLDVALATPPPKSEPIPIPENPSSSQ